jgi:hypothetical protein
MEKVAERFRGGSVPETLELEGAYRVHLLAAPLPPLRFFGHRKVFERAAGGITGVNEFLGAVRLARFRVQRTASLDGSGLEVARIAYDEPCNPFFVRPLVDEIRQVGPEEWLGQGFYPVLGRLRRVMWFSIKR